MMKTKFCFGALALAAAMLPSCSSDELVESGVVDANVITFSASSEMTSRAVESYCNTNLPEQFNVLAKYSTDNSIYFDTQVASKQGSTWGLAQTAYWPSDNLDFVAWVNATENYDYNNGQPKFSGFKPAATAQEQLDFLYAVTLNKNQEVVKLNFRHALSQIVFRADNKSGLTINIKGVKVGKVHSEGNFTLPALATDQNYENHGYEANGEEWKVDNQGTWEGVEASALTDYNVAFDAAAIGEDIVWLTDVNHKQGGDLSMILLPQQAEAWNPEVKGDDFNGAYFALDVEMINKDGKTVYAGLACVPVSINWEQGVRYIYTFHFTEGGNGGYTPTPDDPKPVLGGITFDLTTDDFKPADNEDKNMETSVKTVEVAFNVPALEIAEKYTIKESETKEVAAPAYDEKLAKEGFNFIGWATTENATEVEYAAGATIKLTAGNSSVTLYPVYEKIIVKHETTFSIPAIEYSETVEVVEGETAEFLIPATVPTKEGWTFKGWATTEDGEVAYQPEGTVTIAAGETVVLYPVFEQNKVAYTLTVDMLGGAENLTFTTEEVIPGEPVEITVPKQQVTVKEGELEYDYFGLTKTAVSENGIGSKTQVDYLSTDKITLTGDMTLYALYVRAMGGAASSGGDTEGEVD